MKELKQHTIDAHQYTFRLRKIGQYYRLKINQEWSSSLWHHTVDDVALVLFMYKSDDSIGFVCWAIDNNPHGTVTLRSNANDKHSAKIIIQDIPIESIRKFAVDSRRQLRNKVALSYFANNVVEVCFNM